MIGATAVHTPEGQHTNHEAIGKVPFATFVLYLYLLRLAVKKYEFRVQSYYEQNNSKPTKYEILQKRSIDRVASALTSPRVVWCSGGASSYRLVWILAR
jgi:hypothetical protein